MKQGPKVEKSSENKTKISFSGRAGGKKWWKHFPVGWKLELPAAGCFLLEGWGGEECLMEDGKALRGLEQTSGLCGEWESVLGDIPKDAVQAVGRGWSQRWLFTAAVLLPFQLYIRTIDEGTATFSGKE